VSVFIAPRPRFLLAFLKAMESKLDDVKVNTGYDLEISIGHEFGYFNATASVFMSCWLGMNCRTLRIQAGEIQARNGEPFAFNIQIASSGNFT
jgi:hypothetical protein